ncbi:hypothetical protein [Amycolatopsis sp. NPDC006125]|uniref:hypothetical protein n=1 Tax=Amycolatopsis sp. NPDC006125 TaxID=3156730 RepID=UPI0033BDBA20
MQVHYEWQGEALHIYDHPWGFAPEPRVILPDDHGRYEIHDVWFPIAPPLATALGCRHQAARAILAGDAPPRATPEMLTYLTAFPKTGPRTRHNLEKLLARTH